MPELPVVEPCMSMMDLHSLEISLLLKGLTLTATLTEDILFIVETETLMKQSFLETKRIS